MLCETALSSENQFIVMSEGATDISVVFGKTALFIKIITHEKDIGKPSDGWPKKRLTSCTYSRYPCSLVDSIGIIVNDKELFLPRSIYSDLADISTAEISMKQGQFILTLRVGDASESYTTKIYFDNIKVHKRKVFNNFDGQLMQETIYYSSLIMD